MSAPRPRALAVRRTAQNIDVLRAQLEACITACAMPWLRTCAAECGAIVLVLYAKALINPHAARCAPRCAANARTIAGKALPLVLEVSQPFAARAGLAPRGQPCRTRGWVGKEETTWPEWCLSPGTIRSISTRN